MRSFEMSLAVLVLSFIRFLWHHQLRLLGLRCFHKLKQLNPTCRVRQKVSLLSSISLYLFLYPQKKIWSEKCFFFLYLSSAIRFDLYYLNNLLNGGVVNIFKRMRKQIPTVKARTNKRPSTKKYNAIHIEWSMNILLYLIWKRLFSMLLTFFVSYFTSWFSVWFDLVLLLL